MKIEQIQIIVENYFKLYPGSTLKVTRKREIVQARQIIQYFAKKKNDDRVKRHKLKYNTDYRRQPWFLSLAEIGKKTGSKDHATVLHSINVVNNLIDTDKVYRQDIYELAKLINRKYENAIKQSDPEKLRRIRSHQRSERLHRRNRFCLSIN